MEFWSKNVRSYLLLAYERPLVQKKTIDSKTIMAIPTLKSLNRNWLHSGLNNLLTRTSNREMKRKSKKSDKNVFFLYESVFWKIEMFCFDSNQEDFGLQWNMLLSEKRPFRNNVLKKSILSLTSQLGSSLLPK